MNTNSVADRNWDFLVKLLPRDWEETARKTEAVVRCRGFRSVSDLLRGLLLHIGLGCSLRETVVVAKAAGWMEMSDVALLKKLRQSEEWLRRLCVGLLADGATVVPQSHGLRVRLIDATHVTEPGQTGSQWRIHYSLRVPEWRCDHFQLTPDRGSGNGESLSHFPVHPGDCLIADRGYAHAAGIAHVQRLGGYMLVRHNPQALPLEIEGGGILDTLRWLRRLPQPGEMGSCPVYLGGPEEQRVALRMCAIHKSPEAVLASQRKLRRRAQRKGEVLRPETLEYARWIIVITTVPARIWDDASVLEWYRLRWQIELAFKRLKALAGFGHLPKHDPASSRAWIYGKLLLALLTEKMQRYAGDFSPWGGHWCDPEALAEPVA